MPTRFYLPSIGSAAVEPAFDAAWTDTVDAVSRAMAIEKTGTTAINRTAGGEGAGPANVLIVQFVSAPLAAQTINGTVKGQFKARELSGTINARAQFVARVVSNDGSSVRGTLVAAQAEALSSEFSTTASNRKFPLATLSPVTVTSVDAQDGDRLVIEAGALVDDNGINQIVIMLQDDQASDLPENETATLAANPWIEFSAAISFQVAAGDEGYPSRLGLGLGMGV